MLQNLKGLRFSADVVLRVLADQVMVALSFAAAAGLYLLLAYGSGAGPGILGQYLPAFLQGLALLMPLSFVVFAASGFYTRSRAYRGRYKMLVVAQAVVLTYLLYGFTVFMLPFIADPPSAVVLLSLLFTLGLVLGARAWVHYWYLLELQRKARSEGKGNPAPSPSGNDRTILVIGGAGYIGSALLPRLLERGYQVRLLDLLMFGKEPIADVLHHPNLEIIQADFRQVDKVVQAMRGVDTVVHLGGLVGDPACALDENLTIEINLVATRTIAEIAKGMGVRRFIFASTCSVYGASDMVLNERSSLNPVSLYARSKIASEQVLHKLQSDDFSLVILRFGTIYGLSGRTRFDLVVNLLTAKAVVEKKITVFGGDQWRPFVHVDDAARAVLLAVEAPKELVHNQTFNVGSNEGNMTLGMVGELVKKLVPDAELIDSGRDGDRRNYRVDFSKIRNVLGFEPQWTVEQGIRQVIEALRSGRVKDYKAPLYSNVKYLTEDTASEVVKQYYLGWERELIERAHLQTTDEKTPMITPQA
ncbi:MAG: NAD(P)-dependent oxidoreductase [Meiothermus sp.]|uniref:NAD-dependent epimerase/dehydratase family protein n=1 Tax=Meiothermus sp. TaxID=1955249 RepID=UPI0025E3FF68|nr:NAD(P)-dependent oxidoreductase [Meiothermus sp.]MCS7057711.1 NAD(P)-dependent oxidoreductase [Meiothermus sp.]